MAMVMVAFLMVLIEKITTIMMMLRLEHDVNDDLIVDSRRRLEQRNIMSSTPGAAARGKIRSDKE